MAKEHAIDYYFWVLSDWAYFGGPRLCALADRHGAAINYMPVKLPSVYARTGGILLQERSRQRQDYRIAELKRWRDRLGMPLNLTPRGFPTNEDLASCFIIAAKLSGHAVDDISNAILKAVWVDELDIGSHETVLMLGKQHFENAEDLLRMAETPDVLAVYERYTNEAIERGVFGSPFYLFNGNIFWGQDRLDFLEEALVRAKIS